MVLLEEVASQLISDTAVDHGDSVTFDYTIDLPAVAVADRSDLKIELFASQPLGSENLVFAS